ncbi:hypothetical protein TNCV_392201 [Trichonephila clavipes]|nr:hypothetical protein TNCV_392201 [Trichonephila clavipes]
MTFAAALTLSSETKAAATLDAVSQTGAISMVGSTTKLEARMLLARHHTPVPTVDELWHRIEAAWASVPVCAIQSLFDSIPKRISAVISARGGCSRY